MKIKSPTNAKSLKFNLNFYTYEWPGYICSEFNDFFVAMMTLVPKGQPDGNISFDTKGNLISVNAGFLDVCGCDSAGGPPCQTTGAPSLCKLGNAQLKGTGFDEGLFGDPTENSAATGWLATTSPIQQPGAEISLLFAVWDSGRRRPRLDDPARQLHLRRRRRGHHDGARRRPSSELTPRPARPRSRSSSKSSARRRRGHEVSGVVAFCRALLPWRASFTSA